MSFLSIAFLAALPLAAAPILLHLFDRRRQVVIEWGAMQFLVEAATRRTSARRLKQWLLLVLRVLAVTALVLALARPMLPGSWFGASERGETVLVIDNSMSMSRASEGESLFERAIARAGQIAAEIETGDSVRVLLTSPYPVWARGGSLRIDAASRKILAEELSQLRATHGRGDLLASLLTAAQAEIEPLDERRRIVLLSDGQSSDWNLTDAAAWQRFGEVLHNASVPTELDIIELEGGAAPQSNLAVDRIHANRIVVGVDQTFTLTAQVANHGSRASAPCGVTWRIAKKAQFAARVPALDGGRAHDVVWKHSFEKAGVYAITCQIDAEDELAPDNRATIVIEVVQRVPIVVLEGAADRSDLEQDAFFLEAALGYMHGEPLGERSVHEPLVVEPDRLARLDLARYRAVVIPNLTALDAELIARLREFVLGGGGLWIALGPRTDIEAFNQQFFADGNGLAPLAIDQIVEDRGAPQDEAAELASKTRIDPFANSHPATVELAGNQQLDTADIAVPRRFHFVPPPAGRAVSVLLSLTDGQPLAVEKRLGRGRVIVQSIPLRLEWSQLARSQTFVVMAHDWLAWLTEPLATEHNLSPGKAISLHLTGEQPRTAMLQTPHGDEIELTADTTSDGVLFRSSRTILPGDYWLELDSSGQSIPFHVSRDPAESDLTPLASQQRRRLSEVAELGRNVDNKHFTVNPQRDPLWPTLLVILIGLMAAELILSGMIARDRFGTEPIAESTQAWMTQPSGMPAMVAGAPLPQETMPTSRKPAPPRPAEAGLYR